MPSKIAVAIIHGVGRQEASFARETIDALRGVLTDRIGGTPARSDFVFRPVHWAPVLQTQQDLLWERVQAGGAMDWTALRRFMLDFAGDAIAYQPTPGDRTAYDQIHLIVARELRQLARDAGGTAPLGIIGHSMGTAVASNYIYDLAKPSLIADEVKAEIGDSPLERGETLAGFYTLGSPIALWSVRYTDFGEPIRVPDPRLSGHHPRIEGEWLNLYDKDDVIGYPLAELNATYGEMVTDLEVGVGGLMTGWNPASHGEYWTDKDVIEPIAHSLERIWQKTD